MIKKGKENSLKGQTEKEKKNTKNTKNTNKTKKKKKNEITVKITTIRY